MLPSGLVLMATSRSSIRASFRNLAFSEQSGYGDPRVASRGRGESSPGHGCITGRERGMHAEVVTALDVHIAELQSLRHRLTDARAIEPGERLDVVLRIAVSAERLAHTVH